MAGFKSVRWVVTCISLLLFILDGAVVNGANEPTETPPKFEWNQFLGPWKVLGPFPRINRNQGELERRLVENELTLRPGDPVTVDGKPFEWRPWPGRMIDLIRALDADGDAGEYALAYAYTEFTSDSDQDALMAFSHDDGIVVWLNDVEVCRDNFQGASHLDQTTKKVRLTKGTNRLLVKITQAFGEWELGVRFRPTDIDKPLIWLNMNAAEGDVTHLPTLHLDLLAADGTTTSTLHLSGGRIVTPASLRYTAYLAEPVPAPAQARVRFDEPGLVPFDKTFSWSQLTSGNSWLRLDAKDALRGQFVDAQTLKPIAGAEIIAGNTVVNKPSDAEGRFELKVSNPLMGAIEVRARGYETRRARVDRLDGQWVVKLKPGGHIFRGRVVDAAGRPLVGAKLTAYTSGRDLNLSTDDEGRFEVFGLPSSATSIYPTVTYPDYVAKDGFNQPLESDGLTEVEYRLELGCVVTGHVVAKEDGAARSGIEIVSGTDRFASNRISPRAYTDAEGNYRLTGIKPGSAMIHAFSYDFVPVQQTVSASRDKPATADFALQTGQPISGRVLDPDGKPVAGMTLAIDTINGTRMLERRVQTDRDGKFLYTNMPDTPVRIDMFKQGWVSKRDFSPKGGDDVDVTVYPVIEHTVRVRLADTGKAPSSLTAQIGYQWQGQQEISWQDEDYSSNSTYDPAAGVFRIRTDEGSEAKLSWRLRVTGYRDAVVANPEVGSPSQQFDVVLEPVEMTRGKVVSADTGEPLAGVLVALVSPQDRLHPDYYVDFNASYRAIEQFTGIQATTAADGSFELAQTGASAGVDLVLFKQGSGFHFIRDAAAVLTGGDVALPMPAAGNVAGRVLVAGQPVPDAQVHLSWLAPVDPNRQRDLPFGFGGQLKCDAAGQFRYEGVGPGRYRISRVRSFDSPDGRGSMSTYVGGAEIVVLPGQTVEHEFNQPAGRKLSGQAVGADDKPAANCQVSLMSTDQPQGQVDVAMSDADGNFAMENLQPGNYTYRANQYESNEYGGFGPGAAYANGTVKIGDGDASLTIKMIAQPQRQRSGRTNASTDAAILVGSVPPDFTGKLFDNDKSFTLSDHFGKVIVIDFWAAFGGPSLATMPETKKLYNQYKDSGDVVFITISLDQDADALRKTIKDQEIEVPVIHESPQASRALMTAFGVPGIPAAFVIGRDGRFASERLSPPQLVAAIEAAVKAPAASVTAGVAQRARLKIQLRLDDEATGVPGAKITLKTFDDIGMPVGDETLKTPGVTKQLTWLYPAFESGGRIVVGVEAPDLPPQEKTIEAPGQEAVVAFDFASPRVIRGTVSIDDGGKKSPVAGIKINVSRPDGFNRFDTSAADGTFAVHVMPGSYYVAPVGNGDLAPIATERVPLEVAADHDPEPLAISACRTVTVKGIVTDEDDLPVDGVQVRTAASEQSVTTDKAGRFELSGVPSRGKVQLYAMKQPKFALVALEDCDGSEPQTLVLRSQQSGGAATLTKGTPTPQLPLYELADGDSVDWKPVKGRQTLLVFAPLWHPMTHDILARAKAWATEHDAQLAIVSTDWSLDAARREADDFADLVSDANPILFAGPGGIEIAKDWNLKGPAQAYLINANGKIAAAPPPGSLP